MYQLLQEDLENSCYFALNLKNTSDEENDD